MLEMSAELRADWLREKHRPWVIVADGMEGLNAAGAAWFLNRLF